MAFPKVSKSLMSTATGPTGTLSSARGGVKSGGTRRLGGSKGLVSSPAKSMKRR